MRHRQDQRASVPAPAERARTLTARGGSAAVLAAGAAGRTEPALHHVYQDGATMLLLPEDHPLSALVELTPGGEVSAMIELTDTAPVALRRPVRGLLWITGWLRALSPKQARHVAMDVAAHRYDHRLLDVGYGSMLLWLHPVFAVLSDAEGTAWLTPRRPRHRRARSVLPPRAGLASPPRPSPLRPAPHPRPPHPRTAARGTQPGPPAQRGPPWLTVADRGRRAGPRPPAFLPTAGHQPSPARHRATSDGRMPRRRCRTPATRCRPQAADLSAADVPSPFTRRPRRRFYVLSRSFEVSPPVVWCGSVRTPGHLGAESAVFGDAAGWAAVAAGLAALVQWGVEGAVAAPALAAQYEAARVVWARTRSPGGGVTIFPGLVHAPVVVSGGMVAVRAR